MSDAFRTKAQHFAQQVISDVKANSSLVTSPTEPTAADQPPTVEAVPAVVVQPEVTGKEPQAYHEESRQSEFGRENALYYLFNSDYKIVLAKNISGTIYRY